MRLSSGLSVVLGAVLLVLALPAEAVDPFYLTRLREGITAAERGSFEDAAKSFEIACFGMLDEPTLLAECLVRLAVAEADGGDRAGFNRVFRRLVEGEELVGLYGARDLPPELERAFEERAAALVSPSILESFPPLTHLVEERMVSELERLPPRQRRRELERRMEREPDVPLWPLLSARLDMQEDRPRDSLEKAEKALSLDEALDEARCLRGWARARLGRCPDAIGDLEECSWRRDPAFGAELLDCLVAGGQWERAEAVLAEMPRDWLESPRVGELSAAVDAATSPGESGGGEEGVPVRDETAEPVADEPVGAGAREGEDAGEGSEVASAESVLSPGEARTLRRARELAAGAREADDLTEAYALVTELAVANPGSREVHLTAGEIAYRASRWSDAARHFDLAGDPGDDRPRLLFYWAVSLYETGREEAAAAVLERCVDTIKRTSFVQSYVDRILGSDR